MVLKKVRTWWRRRKRRGGRKVDQVRISLMAECLTFAISVLRSKLNQKSYKLCRIICLTEEDLLALTFDWLCLLFKFLLEHNLTNDKNPSMEDRNGDSPSLAIEGQLPEMSSKIANLWLSETLYMLVFCVLIKSVIQYRLESSIWFSSYLKGVWMWVV